MIPDKELLFIYTSSRLVLVDRRYTYVEIYHGRLRNGFAIKT